MITLTFTPCSNHSALSFKFTAGFTITIYHFSLATVRGEWLLRMILEVKSTSNINKSQKLCLTRLSKLFVACSSWRILKHRLNHIFHYHLLRMFESFQDTSKIPTFTLLIKNNAQLHLKMLSCNFYFLKNLTDFRHIILQPAGKFNPKFF